MSDSLMARNSVKHIKAMYIRYLKIYKQMNHGTTEGCVSFLHFYQRFLYGRIETRNIEKCNSEDITSFSRY
jgi:hypothetical protein